MLRKRYPGLVAQCAHWLCCVLPLLFICVCTVMGKRSAHCIMQCVVSITCLIVCAVTISVRLLASTGLLVWTIAKIVGIELIVYSKVKLGVICVAKAAALSKLFAFTTNCGASIATLHLHAPMLPSSDPSCSPHCTFHNDTRCCGALVLPERCITTALVCSRGDIRLRDQDSHAQPVVVRSCISYADMGLHFGRPFAHR